MAYIWATYFVPETARLSLEEIDKLFRASAGREEAALKSQVESIVLLIAHCFCLFDMIFQIEGDLGLTDLIRELIDEQ